MEKRFMEGISVADEAEIRVLCDDSRSLMQQLCKTQQPNVCRTE
jgi:hypothetical protein